MFNGAYKSETKHHHSPVSRKGAQKKGLVWPSETRVDRARAKAASFDIPFGYYGRTPASESKWTYPRPSTG